MFSRVLLILPLLLITASAQPAPRALFERARMLEESNNKLTDAIRLYTQVAAQSADRQLAAAAQLRIGLLHERLGQKAEAQRAFQAVVERHADQLDVVRQARAKLDAGSVAHDAGPRARQIWLGQNVTPFSAPSPDGRYLSYMDAESGNLAVRDVATGATERLTTDAAYDKVQWVEFTVFSPDSRQIAYGWYRSPAYELRVVALDGSKPRIIYKNDNTSFVHPFAWTPDGRRVLAELSDNDGTRRIVFVTVATGEVRTIKTLDWRASVRAALSPDGAWIAYDFPPDERRPERDIYLLASDGSRETRLVEHSANDLLPLWTPDGEQVVFLTDRGDGMALWIQRVANGQPRGPARLLKADMNRTLPLGFTARGSLYYVIQSGQEDIYTAAFDDTGALAQPPARLNEHLVGANSSPDWSPDGSQLAYVSKRLPRPLGQLLGARSLCILDLASKRVRELSLPLAYIERPRWSPDGRELLVGGQVNGRAGLYRVAVATGEMVRVAQLDRPEYFNSASWSRDGRTIFYVATGAGAGQRVIAADSDGNLVRVIDDSPYPKSDLAVSHDGRTLAYRTSAQAAGARPQVVIRTIRLADGARADLPMSETMPPFGFRGINWTNDDRHLIFVTADTNARRFFFARVPAGGGAAVAIGSGFERENLLDTRLHPDGRRIAFTSREGHDEIWAIENFLPSATAGTVAGRRERR
jgi:Tol biopolymer transport system component